MTVIDVHAHIYPDKIAQRAADSVGEFYDIPDHCDGTVETYLSLCEGSPITRHIVCSVATKPHLVETINTFVAQTCAAHPSFIGFATMHQDYENPEREIERALSLGLKGIKLHPDSQGVNVDDERLMGIFDIAQRKRLPVIVHCGDPRYDFTHPRRTKNVLREFPDLVVDAAHLGGWRIFDDAVRYLRDESCFLDMSSCQAYVTPQRMKELCRAFGTDRILFGSDYPMWDPADELRRFGALGFSEEEYQDMTYRNAERFLGLRP